MKLQCEYCKKDFNSHSHLINHIIFILCELQCCKAAPLCRLCDSESYCPLYQKLSGLETFLQMSEKQQSKA